MTKKPAIPARPTAAIGLPFIRQSLVGSAGPSARRILRTLKKPTIPFSSQYTIRIIHTFQPKKIAPNSGMAFATISATTAPVEEATRYQPTIRSTGAMLPQPTQLRPRPRPGEAPGLRVAGRSLRLVPGRAALPP